MELLTTPVTLDALAGEVTKLKTKGYRFVTMSCVDMDADTVEIIYHFDKDLELVHLRSTVSKKESAPSISPIYFTAFLVENEINDHFGITFDDLVLDFGGTLYLEGDVRSTPFCKYSIKEDN